jgi:N-acyl-D-aspartate/D-glutamate deacylase
MGGEAEEVGMHDLVMKGGTVIDGTGSPAHTADVTVGGGGIVARQVGN